METKAQKKLQSFVKGKAIIEIEIFDDELLYSGVCLKANNDFWAIVDYNLELGVFDGFTIFRNQDIESYAKYKRNSLQVNVNSNIDYFSERFDKFLLVETYEDLLKKVASEFIVSLFDEKNTSSYYVGKLINSELKRAKFQLFDIDGFESEQIWLNYEEIHFFSFDSKYENNLMKLTKDKNQKPKGF